MRKRVIVGSIVVLFVAALIPVFRAQGAGVSLGSLATKVNILIKKTRYINAISGKIAARYVTFAPGTTGLGTSLQAAVTNLALQVARQKQATNIVYANSVSGLTSTTLQDAVDEVGAGLPELLKEAGATQPTTWKGYGYSAGSNPLVNGLISKTVEMTATFTPTSETAGTFTSSPLYVFAPAGGDFFSKKYGDTTNALGGISRCGTAASAPNGGIYPTGTFAGKYEITDDFMIWTAPTSSTHENCVVPDQNGNSSARLSEIATKGTTLYITNSAGNQMILQRQ